MNTELENGFTLRHLLDDNYCYDLLYVEDGKAYYSQDVYLSEREGREALARVSHSDVESEGWEPYTHTKEAETLWVSVAHKARG